MHGRGTFLVRKSGSDANGYTLSVRAAKMTVHVRLYKVGPENRWALSAEPDAESWPSIPALINHIRAAPLKVWSWGGGGRRERDREIMEATKVLTFPT